MNTKMVGIVGSIVSLTVCSVMAIVVALVLYKTNSANNTEKKTPLGQATAQSQGGRGKGAQQAPVQSAAPYTGAVATNPCPNGKTCTYGPPVESPTFGEEAGDFHDNQCIQGHFVSGINVGYDEKPQELKYIAAGCTDGQEFQWGRDAPSGIGRALVGALTMGVSEAFFKPNTGYENRTWVHPHVVGWDRFALVTHIKNWKGGSFVRSFGPDRGSMFGVNNRHTILDENILQWSCPTNAPAGYAYKIAGIKTWTTDKGVRGLRFACKPFPNA